MLFTAVGEKIKPYKNENIETMEIFLQEITDKYYGLENQVYGCYANILLRKQLNDSEQFLTQTIAEKDSFIPAMTCLCLCKLVRGGKNALDKNILKSISKSKFNAKWGEETERGWI